MSDPLLVRGPDGAVHRFPAGTSRERIRSAFQQHYGDQLNASQPQQAAPAAPQTPSVATGGRVGAVARSALQGLTFGLGDEIVAGGASLFPGRDYQTELARERQRLEQGREQFPATSLGSEMGGAVATGLATGSGPVAAQRTILGRLGVGAGVGAAEGGAYGFGAGEGGFENRLDNAARGAAVGGFAGAAVPAVVRALQAGGRAVMNPVAGALNLGNQSRAVQSIVRTLQGSGQSVDDIDRALRQAADEGQGAYTVADAMGIEGQRALAGVARQPGPARTMAYDALEQRQLDQSDRIGGFVREAFGDQDTAALQQARLVASRGDDAAVNYGAARASARPVDVSGVTSRIDELLGNDPILGETTLSQGPLGQRLAAFRDRLSSGSEQAIGFDDVMRIRTDLRNYMDANPRAAGQFRGVYDDLTEALRQSSPDFQQANDAYRSASGVIDAVDQGAQAARPATRFADVQARFAGLSPDEQTAYRVGLGDQYLSRLESSATGVDASRPFRTTQRAEIARALADDPDKFLRQIGREDTMFQTRRQAIGGSQTADNMADQAAVNGEDVGIIASLMQGNMGTAAGQVARRFVSGATGNNEGTREAIARALLASDAAPVRQAMDRTMSAQARQRLIDALSRRSAQVGAYGPAGVR